MNNSSSSNPTRVNAPGYGGSVSVAATAATVATVSPEQTSAISFVETPHGPAIQSLSDEALAGLQSAQNGATLYREGVTGVQETVGAQFWSFKNPLTTADYADVMGMPAATSSEGFSFVMAGRLLPGAAAITGFTRYRGRRGRWRS